jgi:DNA-binding CsgD family transcriptional regulator
MREKGFLGFSARELKVIAWRTHGVKGPEIAWRLGCQRHAAYCLLNQAMRKAGVDDVCLLTRWAMANGLDEALGPETEETREVPRPKVYKQRIRLGRLRRSRVLNARLKER